MNSSDGLNQNPGDSDINNAGPAQVSDDIAFLSNDSFGNNTESKISVTELVTTTVDNQATINSIVATEDDSPPIYVVNDAEISIKETTSIENATINTHDSAVATFKTTTSLTAVNLYASGGGQILFPAATSYTGNDYATTTIEASGAGSRINLSALETLVGGGYRGTYRIIKVHCARTAAQAERVILS